MLYPHPATHRTYKQPTEAEIWARLEARSDAMAADLLQQVQSAAATRSRRNGARRARTTALLACGAATALVLFLLR
jgi:ferric-dicitrate binding protein FerR (iron transport regulator)